MISISDLLDVAAAYRIAAGVSEEKTVSSRVLGDSKRLGQLRAGGADITVGRFNAAMQWFVVNWPEGHPCPVVLDKFRPAAAGADNDLVEGAA